MAKYFNPANNQIEEIVPEFNQDLIKGKMQVPETTPLGVITSDNLKPTEILNPQSPSTPSIPDISKIDINSYAPQTLGMEEKKAQTLSEQIQSINNSLLGKSAYKTQKEEEFGLPTLVKTQNDYISQLKSLQNEMADLQNQNTTIESKMQEQAFGRGITAGGLAPLTAGELRKNQIQQATVASKALTISSTLEAVKGNVLTAQMMSDRAVEAKYGPLEEEQRVKLANLDLFLKSPLLSLEEKNKAKAEKIIEEKRQQDIEAKKQTAKDIQIEVFNAVKNGLKDGNIINQMQNSKTAIEAAGIAAQAGFGTNKTETELKQVQLNKLKAEIALNPLNKKYKQAQIDKLNAEIKKIQNESVGTGGTKYIPGSNPTVDNWAKLIIAGQAKITEVPNPKGSTMRSQVVDAITNSGQILLSDKDREKLATLDTAINVYNIIKNLSGKVNTFGVRGRITGFLGRYIGGKTQYNDDIALYNSTREGFVSNTARTLGEKGALSEGDVSRAIKNFPTVNDTKAVTERKLNILKNILEGAKTAIIQTSTEPLNKITSGTLNNQTGILKSPDGLNQVNLSDLTPAQIEEAKNAGWK